MPSNAFGLQRHVLPGFTTRLVGPLLSGGETICNLSVVCRAPYLGTGP